MVNECEPYKYQFVAGNLALDFVNTVAYRFHPAKREDHLQSSGDLHRWADQASLQGREAITKRPLSRPALQRTVDIREQLFAIFHAIASHAPVSSRDLRAVGDALQNCRAKQCLSAVRTDIRWSWRPAAGGADILLFPILTAAVDLLTSDSRQRIRHCADAECGWLFLDRSNSHRRRWCSMADCGNRHKVREFYRRGAV